MNTVIRLDNCECMTAEGQNTHGRMSRVPGTLAILILLSAIPLIAQQVGSVLGTLFDPQGAAVPNATISLSRGATTAALPTNLVGISRFRTWRRVHTRSAPKPLVLRQ